MIKFNIGEATPGRPVQLDGSFGMHPSTLTGYHLESGSSVDLVPSGMDTFFLYVFEGTITLRFADAPALMVLSAGHFASGGRALVECEDGPHGDEQARVAVFERRGFRGVRTIGCVEDIGRLPYPEHDGCSVTDLIGPPHMGDPSLSHLHLPPMTVLPERSRSSLTMGIVAKGKGCAWGFGGGSGRGWTENLEPGTMFAIREHERCSYRTDQMNGAGELRGQTMDLIMYRPSASRS